MAVQTTMYIFIRIANIIPWFPLWDYGHPESKQLCHRSLTGIKQKFDRNLFYIGDEQTYTGIIQFILE